MREHKPRSDDAAAYALGALPDSEAAEFLAHAESCPECAAELERFTGTASVLALAAPQREAPARLRRTVIAAAAGERRGVREQARSWWPGGLLVRPQPIGALALAVGLLVGALVIGHAGAKTTKIRASVASASLWHATRRPVAYLERTGDRAELVVADLPQPPSGKVYELWIERDGKPQPTDALFEPTHSGSADADVPGGVAGASAVMVTVEPRGGTKVPTTPPLINAALQA